MKQDGYCQIHELDSSLEVTIITSKMQVSSIYSQLGAKGGILFLRTEYVGQDRAVIFEEGKVVNLYILPVQRVLLEYVLKLGEIILFPGDVSSDVIEGSKLSDTEKEKLQLIVKRNHVFFEEYLTGVSFLLMSSKYDASQINSDVNVLGKILNEANRAFDYIRILECPFNRAEYTIGIPGLMDGIRVLFSINDNYSIETYISGEEEFYSMQKGIGLDLGVTEDNDPGLYRAIYSHRHDEVYNLYRRYIAEACDALQISDSTRCFIFLFSKIDAMGLCDAYRFVDNKKRILSVIAETQSDFDILSSQLYFYSKEIRTEVVHKGKRIDELVPFQEAQNINQKLFNIIIQFCVKVISTKISSIEALKELILGEIEKYAYEKPQETAPLELPAIYHHKTTYVASLEGLQIYYPQKRGNYLLIPSLNQFDYNRYYRNYISKDLRGEYEDIFEDFSIDDLEYIIEILHRREQCDDEYPRVIGIGLPKISDEYFCSPILREQLVDYICNELNNCMYYDMLAGGDIVNGEILPPKAGIRAGIRTIYEFVEDQEGLFLRCVPGRVYSEYQIPKQEYECINFYNEGIGEILFGNANYIDNLCKRFLTNICEVEYIRDWTQRISYLFDIFDGIDPRNYNKEKVIKLVFTIIANDKADYLQNKQKYEQLKNKYRNPILHGGRNIFELEADMNEIRNVDRYLQNTIMDYCRKVHSLGISTWEELDTEYRMKQEFLKLNTGNR